MNENEEKMRHKVMEELDKMSLTTFQKEVLMAVYSIPKGKTKTYAQIAHEIGHKGAYRAVGTVMKNNPLAPIIPCHRVIRSDGKIGNYSGKGGKQAKVQMLKDEGPI